MKGIHLEQVYPHPVERVWEAIATSRGLAAWLMPNDFEPRVGHRFQFRWKRIPGWRGIVDCEVQRIEPLRCVAFSWRGEEKHRPTTVTPTLERVTEGRLALQDAAAATARGADVASDYWNVTDEQVLEKTGRGRAHWRKVLDRFGAKDHKSNDVVAHLVQEHGMPRYWARTPTTNYLKQQAK